MLFFLTASSEVTSAVTSASCTCWRRVSLSSWRLCVMSFTASDRRTSVIIVWLCVLCRTMSSWLMMNRSLMMWAMTRSRTMCWSMPVMWNRTSSYIRISVVRNWSEIVPVIHIVPEPVVGNTVDIDDHVTHIIVIVLNLCCNAGSLCCDNCRPARSQHKKRYCWNYD